MTGDTAMQWKHMNNMSPSVIRKIWKITVCLTKMLWKLAFSEQVRNAMGVLALRLTIDFA